MYASTSSSVQVASGLTLTSPRRSRCTMAASRRLSLSARRKPVSHAARCRHVSGERLNLSGLAARIGVGAPEVVGLAVGSEHAELQVVALLDPTSRSREFRGSGTACRGTRPRSTGRPSWRHRSVPRRPSTPRGRGRRQTSRPPTRTMSAAGAVSKLAEIAARSASVNVRVLIARAPRGSARCTGQRRARQCAARGRLRSVARMGRRRR